MISFRLHVSAYLIYMYTIHSYIVHVKLYITKKRIKDLFKSFLLIYESTNETKDYRAIFLFLIIHRQ